MLTGFYKQVSRSSIGVSLEGDCLRLAECRYGRIFKWQDVPYPVGLLPESEGFSSFLKECLTSFMPSVRRVPVWAVGALPSLQMRFLSLPGVQSRALSDMVYWTFRKDLPFNPEQTLFDYGREYESGSGAEKKIHVTAYTASRRETDALVELFAKAGVGLSGILIPAIAMRNLFKSVRAAHVGTQLCLFAGNDSSSVIIIKDGNVHSSRVFKTGMTAIIGVIQERHPGCGLPEAYQRVQDAMSSAGRDTDEDAVLIREVFDRLVQQIERTIAAYLNDHAGETLNGLYVMGAIAGLRPFVQALSSRLGVEVCQVPMQENRAAAGGRAAGATETTDVPGLAAIAAGASISHIESTPNLLYTYRYRDGVTRRSLWGVLSIFGLGIMLAMVHLSGELLKRSNAQLAARLKNEKTQIAWVTSRVDQPRLQAMTVKAVADSVALKRMARQWLPLAEFQLLAAQTPPGIRLTSIEMISAGADAGTTDRQGLRGGEAGPVLRISGTVDGLQAAQRSKLAAYALRIEDTLLFTRANVIQSSDGFDGASPVLLFEMQLEVVPLTGAVTLPGEAAKEATP